MNLDDLSPELREKAMACETPDELFALAKAEGVSLSDEQLDAISGGWSPKCNHDTSNCKSYTKNKKG